jgi:potassium efflux system protein
MNGEPQRRCAVTFRETTRRLRLRETAAGRAGDDPSAQRRHHGRGPLHGQDPDHEFVTGRLLNWSLSDQMTRVVVVAGVAYGSDVDKALALMREAAEEHEHVLDDPPPVLSFEGFGDNALTLILRAYLSSIDDRIATITDLHKAINRKFADAGIVIAFPQRDVHLDTSKPLQVELRQQPGDSEDGGSNHSGAT